MDIARHAHPWLVVATAARATLLLANIALAVNFAGTACRIMNLSAPAAFSRPAAVEVPAP